MKYFEAIDFIMLLAFIALLVLSFYTLFAKRNREGLTVLRIIQMVGILAFIVYEVYNSSWVDSREREITSIDIMILLIPFSIAIVNGVRLFSTMKKA